MKEFKESFLITVTGEMEPTIGSGDRDMEHRAIEEAIGEPLVAALSGFWQAAIEGAMVTVEGQTARQQSPLEAVQQLERSERGQMTCRMLRDFLKSPTVRGLDASNCAAVIALIRVYMLGTAEHANAVLDALQGSVRRHKWTEES